MTEQSHKKPSTRSKSKRASAIASGSATTPLSLGMRIRALSPFVLTGGTFAILLGSWAYHSWAADTEALEQCQEHGGYACVDLMRKWQGDPKTRAAAWQLGTEKCRGGPYIECSELLAMQLSGAALETPPLAETLTEGCGDGHSDACGSLAILVMHDDPPKARALWERSCSLNDSNGCYNLAQWMLEGKGGPVDRSRGMKLLEAACAMRPGQPGIPEAPSNECMRLAKEKLSEATQR